MLQFEYARSGLQIGLEVEENLGVNPYAFGMIGSTDSHTALATAGEDNFFGKHSGVEPNAERYLHPMAKMGDAEYTSWSMASSGYAGVWATENTRRAIFDAMMRKETYATTGPRMLVRFFGGFDFTEADTQSRLPADAGYMKGAPMGSTFRGSPEGKPMTFLVAALKDPLSGNLDRIQIIKGWLRQATATRFQKTYNVVPGQTVVSSGARWQTATGRATPWISPTASVYQLHW